MMMKTVCFEEYIHWNSYFLIIFIISFSHAHCPAPSWDTKSKVYNEVEQLSKFNVSFNFNIS